MFRVHLEPQGRLEKSGWKLHSHNQITGDTILLCPAGHRVTMTEEQIQTREYVPCDECAGVIRAMRAIPFDDPDYLKIPGFAE